MAETLFMTLNSQEQTWLVLRQVDSSGNITRTSYPVFSGAGEHKNNPNSTHLANAGPIPKGKYFVVDRPTGGRLGPLWDTLGGKDIWFALYRDDGNIDDQTVIDDTVRGQFRMHPGTRSVGCVTFVHRKQFDQLREILLDTQKETIPKTSISYYATLTVD